MNLNLKGQTAVIVGAARGIGLAIAREFAREGANVGLLDREEFVVKAAVMLADEFGIRAGARVGDVTSFEAMKQTAAQFQGDLGRIDHLIYAVGVGSGKFGFP